MMQAVYQVALQHHLRERKESYGQWLYEALFRCHLSMTFAKEKCPKMSGALFSGRRTGHHIFTIAQVLYHSRFYTGEGGGGKCIGTSSVDAWCAGGVGALSSGHFCNSLRRYTLSKVLKFPGIVPPAGTHAHELSMVRAWLFITTRFWSYICGWQVLMSLMPQLDQNDESLVMTQAVGHWLYYRLVHQGYKLPMPMLPDTLGSYVSPPPPASLMFLCSN